MTVGVVEPAFTGQAYTNNGNQYDKSSIGKKVGAGVGVVLSGIGMLRGRDSIKESFKLAGKGPMIAGLAISLAIRSAVWLGIGAIVDACINASRRSKADKAALSVKV